MLCLGSYTHYGQFRGPLNSKFRFGRQNVSGKEVSNTFKGSVLKQRKSRKRRRYPRRSRDDIFEFLTEVKRKIEIDEQDEDKLIQELEIKI